MKKHTAEDFFNAVNAELKKGRLLPEDLDYGLSNCHEILESDDFNVTFKVDWGGSEGIYLDLYLEGYGFKTPLRFGCYKTLSESRAAYRTMCLLGADFVFAAKDLARKGFFDEGGGQ